MKFLSSAALLSLFTLGCASAVPAERISAADSSIRAAEEVGAPKVPQAALHLQLAKEEIGLAQKLIAEGKPERAEGLLKRAQADAELSVAEAREAPMKVEAANEIEKASALLQKR